MDSWGDPALASLTAMSAMGKRDQLGVIAPVTVTTVTVTTGLLHLSP